MKREQFIIDLINEGLSEKTLVKFSDKQIKHLHERFFGEQIQATTKMGIEMPHVKSGGPDEKTLKQQGKTFVAYEGEMGEGKKLTDKQKKFLDKNKNNKLDAEDFKLLRKGNQKESEINEVGLGILADIFSKENERLEKKLGRKPTNKELRNAVQKVVDDAKAKPIENKKDDKKKDKKESEMNESKKWIQKAIHPSKKGSLKKALGVKKDETIPVEKLKTASKKGGKLGQRARLAMTLKSLKENEILDLFENMVKEKYHPFTSKSEIINMINEKLNVNEDRVPDFFSWDAITSTENDVQQMSSLEEKKSTTTKPAPPKEKEKTKEKTGKPGWSPDPGPNKKPKFKALEEKKSTTTKPAPPKEKEKTKEKTGKPGWSPDPGPNKKPKF